MVETKINILAPSETRAADAPTARANFKAAQVILGRHLGLNFDLTSRGQVLFWQRDKIVKEDRDQVTSTNELAKAIYDRKLPLLPVSNLISNLDNEGILIQDGNNTRLAISLELGSMFAYILPKDSDTREQLSFASIILFRNLSELVIESQTKQVNIKYYKTDLSSLRTELLDNIRLMARGERKQDVLDLADTIEEKTSNLKLVSLKAKGTTVEFCLKGQPLWRLSLDDKNVLPSLISRSVEQHFITQMINWNGAWFTPPERWKKINNSQFINGQYEDALKDIRLHCPYLEVPEDAKESLILYINGEFAKRNLAHHFEEAELVIEDIPQTLNKDIERLQETLTNQPVDVSDKKDPEQMQPELISQNTLELIEKFGHLIDQAEKLEPADDEIRDEEAEIFEKVKRPVKNQFRD